MDNYDDIISHERYRLQCHTPMAIHDRASQFSSFKALEGFEDEIAETARLTDSYHEMTEDELSELNEQLYFLSQNEYMDIEVKLLYFKPDSSKFGGSYTEYNGIFKYFNVETQELVFTDGFAVKIDRVYSIMTLKKD